ncbi:hypothetical protein JCM5353_008810 [Sporobolomyces roseus]
MSTSQFSSNPIPYSALSTEAEDPLHPDNPYTPSPSYPSDGKAARTDPYHVDGTPRTQLEFYHKELSWLREENAKLKEENLALRQREIDELRAEVKERKGNRECGQIALYLVGGILSFFVFIALFAKIMN